MREKIDKIHSCFDDAWLGLGDTSKLEIGNNPLMGRTENDLDNPGLHELRLMRNPDYLAFAAKYLLGVELLPIQALILQELWIRPFPMLIASRGFSKCISKDSWIQTNNGFRQISDVIDSTIKPNKRYYLDNDLFLCGENGFNKVEYYWKNKKQNCIKLETNHGFNLIGTYDHPIRVVRNKRLEWVKLKNIRLDDYIPIDKTEQWFNNTNNLTERKAYNVGCFIAKNEEMINNKTLFLSILSSSKESVAAFLDGLWDVNGQFLEEMSVLSYLAQSAQFIDFLQFILTRFGIISRKDKYYNRKKQKDYYRLTIRGNHLKKFNDKISFKSNGKEQNSVSVNLDIIPHELILDDLLYLRQYCDDDKLLTCDDIQWDKRYLKNNPISYLKLQRILELTPQYKNYNCWQRLNGVLSKQYFYDKVKKIDICEEDTFDFHLSNDHSFFTNGFISHNTYLSAVCALLKCALVPGTKVVIAGAAFRQSKFVFEYMESIWRDAAILRSVCDNSSGPRRGTDQWVMHINDSTATSIPIGTGTKVRGLRANTLIMDEFASINPEIYETVLAGFTAVSADPISNVKEAAKRNAMIKSDIWSDEQEESYMAKTGNQIILSGTASYDFEHFADYWRKYRAIIASKGNEDKIKTIFDGEMPDHFSWKDYSIIRIPYELIPAGFMDDKQIIRAQATMHSGTYGKEYGAVFVKDSSGFFKRTLIESCVANDKNMQKQSWPPWCPKKFQASLRGSSQKKYVYGVDPASETDNFSIVVLELWPEHIRVVYCWSTNRKDFKQRLKAGLVSEHDFYGFGARKIRDLMKVFPCSRIGIDALGGGIAVEEALHDPDKLQEGEIPLWPIIDINKEKDTDHQSGSHILEMCRFAKADWVAEANHGLRKDLEDKILLFPFFDSASLGLAIESDKRQKDAFEQAQMDDHYNIYDSLEDCVMEIEEMKNELSTIVMTKAGTGISGRDRWSTPEVKLSTGKKGRLRKDRYSALLIANMIARQMSRAPDPIEYPNMGDALHKVGKMDGSLYQGPEWFTSSMNQGIIFGIRR